MGAFLSHLRNFVEQVFETALMVRGLTLAGFIIGLFAPLLGYLKVVIGRRRSDKKIPLRLLLKPSSGDTYVALLLWSLVVIWAFGATVYKDHESLVAVNLRLSTQLRELQSKPAPICPVSAPPNSARPRKNVIRVGGSITQTSHGSKSPNIIGNDNKP